MTRRRTHGDHLDESGGLRSEDGGADAICLGTGSGSEQEDAREIFDCRRTLGVRSRQRGKLWRRGANEVSGWIERDRHGRVAHDEGM
ncbi:hypothetical protein AKJ09_01846 [Labilithrix luteola]|uniref:Uncharacterized protein n=1 Tax=Labilithrix luteola TaxID=1391654 RepID=A0A0K1PNT9_9BACT|nr:hypothetical protein AKJ09_01846 [Labilithrix luteola]